MDGVEDDCMVGGATYCLLDERTCDVSSAAKIELLTLHADRPANEPAFPGLRKGIGRYFITQQSGTGICLYGPPT